jgi:hypothetical protein
MADLAKVDRQLNGGDYLISRFMRCAILGVIADNRIGNIRTTMLI